MSKAHGKKKDTRNDRSKTVEERTGGGGASIMNNNRKNASRTTQVQVSGRKNKTAAPLPAKKSKSTICLDQKKSRAQLVSREEKTALQKEEKTATSRKPSVANLAVGGTSGGGGGDKTTTLTASVHPKKDKWAGEEAASQWVSKLASANPVAEYEEIRSVPVQAERCKIWSENMAKNRHDDYKCYDDNRIIVQMAKSDYINASKINVPNFPRTSFLAQLPKLNNLDAIEEFWRVVFTEQCSAVHIVAQAGEMTEGGGLEKMFAHEAGKYLYVNGFFINTRKVEANISDKMDNYVVELLPEGCSNSLMCQVYVHTYWKGQAGPEKFQAPVKAAQMIGKTDFENYVGPIVIVSVNGAGRNSSLLALAVLFSQMNRGIEPKIKEIVRVIREQRPMGVDSVAQYLSIYLAASWFVKAKMKNNSDVQQKLKKFRAACDPTSSLMTNATFDETNNLH